MHISFTFKWENNGRNGEGLHSNSTSVRGSLTHWRSAGRELYIIYVPHAADLLGCWCVCAHLTASSVWTGQISTLTDGELLLQIDTLIIIEHPFICPPVASARSILSHFHKSQRSCGDPGTDWAVRTAVIYSKAAWQVKTHENENSWGLEFKNCFKRRNGHLDTRYRFVEWNARNDTDVRTEWRECAV